MVTGDTGENVSDSAAITGTHEVVSDLVPDRGPTTLARPPKTQRRGGKGGSKGVALNARPAELRFPDLTARCQISGARLESEGERPRWSAGGFVSRWSAGDTNRCLL